MEQSHGNGFKNVPVYNFRTGILSKCFAGDMQVEKFANHPRYREAIEQELAVRCFKQKPVSFKTASKHLLQLSDKKDFIPYLNV